MKYLISFSNDTRYECVVANSIICSKREVDNTFVAVLSMKNIERIQSNNPEFHAKIYGDRLIFVNGCTYIGEVISSIQGMGI